MSTAEHRAEAERSLRLAIECGPCERGDWFLALAQVHATLALGRPERDAEVATSSTGGRLLMTTSVRSS